VGELFLSIKEKVPVQHFLIEDHDFGEAVVFTISG
jgi:hypothetical protein